MLLMIADDLGRDLGYFGNRCAVTPVLDAFAAEAVSFDNAFCTTASCSSSRSVIYSGRHNHEIGHYGHSHGINHFATFGGVETLPALFNAHGWLTGIIGKVHVRPDEVYPWSVRMEGDGRNVQSIAARASGVFAQAQKEGRPFHLTIGFEDPHRSRGRKNFANETDWPGVEKRIFTPEEAEVPSFLPDLPEVREELAEYHQSVNRLDQGVGMVLAALKDAGVAEDTMVLFVSDNGVPFLNAKSTLYAAGCRLPFLMRVPGGPRGLRNPNFVSFTDILPTFLDWAGIKAPSSERRGRSLLPVLSERQLLPDWSSAFGSHTFHEVTNYYPVRALRTATHSYLKNVAWKLDFPLASDIYGSLTFEAVRKHAPHRIGTRPIRDFFQRPHEELYDTVADPDETCNLADDPDYSGLLAEMRATVEAWQKETQDPWLYKDGVSWLSNAYHADHGLDLPNCHDTWLPDER
ncbi:sulfatase family protein [Halovulum sp. GXIMD14794]